MAKIGTRAGKWFSQQQRQSMSHHIATIPVIARSNQGDTTSSKTRTTENAEGEALFVVGRTEVGGEEVIG